MVVVPRPVARGWLVCEDADTGLLRIQSTTHMTGAAIDDAIDLGWDVVYLCDHCTVLLHGVDHVWQVEPPAA
jgi:hypothetical protein